MATQVYQTKTVNPEQLVDLQVSTNTAVHAVNHLQDRVSTLTDKVESTLNLKQSEKQKQEDVLDELGQALSGIGKSLTEIKSKKKKEDKPIPEQFLRASTLMSIPSASDLYKPSVVYNPAAKPIQQKFPFFFPPESTSKDPEASQKQPEHLQSMVSIRKPQLRQYLLISLDHLHLTLLAKDQYLKASPMLLTGIKNGILIIFQ
jgi:hypothetical protein